MKTLSKQRIYTRLRRSSGEPGSRTGSSRVSWSAGGPDACQVSHGCLPKRGEQKRSPLPQALPSHGDPPFRRQHAYATRTGTGCQPVAAPSLSSDSTPPSAQLRRHPHRRDQRLKFSTLEQAMTFNAVTSHESLKTYRTMGAYRPELCNPSLVTIFRKSRRNIKYHG